MMGNVNGVMLPGLASTVSPRRDFRCLALNRNGLLSLLDPRGRRHSRHIGGSDALGHACAQSGEPINIGYSMSVTAVLRQMAEHLPFRRLRFRKSHDFQGLQVSDLQIGAVACRLNRLFDGGGRGQEKTVRVHPSSRRILELRASSCPFRKKGWEQVPSLVSPAQKLVASRQARNPRDRPR